MIKKHTKFYNTTSSNRFELYNESNKWTMYVEGYYKKKGNKVFFTHMVKKKFRSEKAAINFFNKRIYETNYVKEENSPIKNDETEYCSFTKPKISIFKKYLFLLPRNDKNQTERKEKLVFKYNIYSNVALFLIPMLFIALDYSLVYVVEFINLLNNSRLENISYNTFVGSLNTILTDMPLVIFMIIILLIEFVYLAINSIVACKWYVVNVYKKNLFKQETQLDEDSNEIPA